MTRHWLYRDVDDPNHLMLSLEFPSTDQATTFLDVLRPVWDMSGAQRAWVLQETDAATY